MTTMNTPPSALSIPGAHDIVRHQLENGIVVLIRENPVSPTVVIDGILRAGAINVPIDKAGLARFTALALLRGAGQRTFSQIFQEIESVGASLSFAAGHHTTEFGGQCLVEDMDLLLDIIQDALFAPSFPVEYLEKLRAEVITGLQIRAHDTRFVARRLFDQLAYPTDHSYHHYAGGTVETIKSLTRRDLVNFHHQYYSPEGMIISVVGDVSAPQIIQKIESRFKNWASAQDQANTQTILPSVPALPGKIEEHAVVPGKTQSDIVLGIAGPPRSASDYLHARLANTILGVFGLMGRLGDNVRGKQGLAYYAYSDLQGGLGPGPWTINAGVNPENVSRAVSSMRDEIRRLQDELVPADELADNKSFMIGSLPLHLETNDGVSNVIADMELFDLGLDYLQRYPERINAITAEQIQDIAQKYLDPDRYALAVAGPKLKDD